MVSDRSWPLCKSCHNGHKPALVKGRLGACQLSNWAWLLKRAFELELEHCPNCGGELRLIGAIQGAPVTERVLTRSSPQAEKRHAKHEGESEAVQQA